MHGSILHCLVSPPELRSCHAHAHLLLLCCLVSELVGASVGFTLPRPLTPPSTAPGWRLLVATWPPWTRP